MAKKLNVKGTVVYENLEGGIWGIRDDKGNNWQPINMPEQLKHKGKKVAVVLKKVDMMTMSMWGETVKIVSFSTLAP